MIEFEVEAGDGTQGTGRYAEGAFTLPDGAVRGIETVRSIAVRDAGTDGAAGAAGSFVASVRGALDPARAVPFPLRLALSTVRAGLGVIEDGLRSGDAVTVEIAFEDGAVVVAGVAPGALERFRRDVALAHAVLARAAPAAAGDVPAVTADATHAPADAASPDPEAAALTSIFRYEKRNGRLRRVAVADDAEHERP